MISIGALTDTVTAHLAASTLVGDGLAPREGGWDQGTPNAGSFKSYTVLACDQGAPALDDLTYPDWEVFFTLRHYGGSRKQCDWQADAVRSLIQALLDQTSGTYKVIGVRWRSLGGPVHVDQTNPPLWQAFDQVALMCSE